MEALNEQLVSLFLSLFKSSELRRLIRGQYGTRFSRLLNMKGSEYDLIRGLVEELVEQDLVDDTLFDALEKRRPEERELIERVRAQYVQDRAQSAVEQTDSKREKESAAGEQSDTISAAQRDWRLHMEAAFDQYSSTVTNEPVNWTDAAAVLPDFDPATIHPFVKTDDKQSMDGFVKLASYCHTRSDGRWELNLEARRVALSRLWAAGDILNALNANPNEKSPHATILRRLAKRTPMPVRESGGYEELLAARDIADWLTGIKEELFNVDRVYAVLERYERIAPLRKLVGKHFRGRKKELKQIRLHASSDSTVSPILTLWGRGGVGKSTLLGKFLLDFDSETKPSRPWAYLDFDDPEIDPIRPYQLIELIARHIGLLYAGYSHEDDFLDIESVAAGDFEPSVDFRIDTSGVQGVEELVQQLAKAIQALPMDASLLLVFDTFEQVQVRGKHAVNLIRDLVDVILDEMPFARVIVSGRADVKQWPDRQEMGLYDLDAESADAVLKVLGVRSEKVRATVVERIGTNPLSLQLVAEGLKNGRLSAKDVDQLIVGARSLELQGQLYTRNLGHISDAEVRRLAHPGLVVRRVTKGVIENVLAEICEIKPERIDALFHKLPDHVALFDPDETTPDEGEALRHRQDVREIMLKLMIDDTKWRDRLNEIHTKAIVYYEKIDHPIARAEELYHRLMRDDDPDILDNIWSEELSASLSRSWGEPFPDRAALWLGLRLGLLQADTFDEKWRLVDREVSIAREAESHMVSGDAEGALQLVRELTDRSAGSKLFAIEAKALFELGRFDEAMTVVESGLSAISEASYARLVLELYQQAAQISFVQKNYDSMKQHCEEAIRLATTLEDSNAQLSMLELLVNADRAHENEEVSAESAKELERLFVETNEEELWRSPVVTEQVVRTLGASSKNVLRKAAVTFGNKTQQNVLKSDAFLLEKLLERADNTDAGKQELSQLAMQVGLPSQKYEMIDLAGAAIRYGRMGDALAVVLNNVGNDEDVRLDTLSMFNIEKVVL